MCPSVEGEEQWVQQGSAVMMPGYLGFLWAVDDGGAFEAARDYAQFQRSVEDLWNNNNNLKKL